MLPPRRCWQFLTLENANSKVWSWHNQVSIGEQTFPYIRVQREAFFQSRDENEIFSYSISHINTRREFLALSLRLQDKTEKNFLSYSRQDREIENHFPWWSEIKLKLILTRIPGFENSQWTLPYITWNAKSKREFDLFTEQSWIQNYVVALDVFLHRSWESSLVSKNN